MKQRTEVGRIWRAYFDHFDYLTPEALREGNHPRVLEHDEPTEKAIVLLHGLTDSPFTMTAIAQFFFERLGYNVYLPLLHGHGLREPKKRDGISFEMWQENAAFGVESARKKSNTVSIGGLSTGGALSVYTAAHHAGITGELYLFSAALDLAGGAWGIAGEIKERVLRTPFMKLMEKFKEERPLVGRNPYRYVRMDNEGAIELSKLIKETDQIIASHDIEDNPFPKRVFAAFSDSDTRVDFSGIARLRDVTPPKRFKLFRIAEEQGVSHASVVLEAPIFAHNAGEGEAPLEKANPCFDEMMDAIASMQEETK